MSDIEQLKEWEMDYVWIPDGYDQKQVPEPTTRNMTILMEKINELVDRVNELERRA